MDPPKVDDVVDLGVVAGSLDTMDAGGLAVSQSFADDKGWELGSEVSVGYADGVVESVAVQAVFEDANILGDLLMHEDAWLAHTTRSDDFIVMVALADGVSVDEGRAAVAPLTERYGAPDAQDRDEYLESATAELDQMLGLVYGLLGLAILIALLGIANTLSLSLHERTRELGLLRAVGQTRRQLRRTVRWESVIIAVFGTVGGLGLGTFLGWGMMRSLEASEGMGTFVAPATTLVIVLAAAIVAGVVAAIRPARRAAKLDVLDAIATTVCRRASSEPISAERWMMRVWRARPTGPRSSKRSESLMPMPVGSQRDTESMPSHSPTGGRWSRTVRSVFMKAIEIGSALREIALPQSASGQIRWNGDGDSSGSSGTERIHARVGPGPSVSPGG